MDVATAPDSSTGASAHSDDASSADRVCDLLGSDFTTQHASGKFGEGYTELTGGLKTAVEGIGDMGEALKGMMQAIQELDEKLAG